MSPYNYKILISDSYNDEFKSVFKCSFYYITKYLDRTILTNSRYF